MASGVSGNFTETIIKTSIVSESNNCPVFKLATLIKGKRGNSVGADVPVGYGASVINRNWNDEGVRQAQESKRGSRTFIASCLLERSRTIAASWNHRNPITYNGVNKQKRNITHIPVCSSIAVRNRMLPP